MTPQLVMMLRVPRPRGSETQPARSSSGAVGEGTGRGVVGERSRSRRRRVDMVGVVILYPGYGGCSKWAPDDGFV